MSSGKTAALGLNQWVLSDQFLMEEFNNDNAKIDDGFKAVDQRFTDMSVNMNTSLAPLALVKIGEVITSQSCQQIDLDVSGIEWEKYLMVRFYWQLNCQHLTSDCASARIFINGKVGAYYRVHTPGSQNAEAGTALTDMLARHTVRTSGEHSFATTVYPPFDEAVFATRNISYGSEDRESRIGLLLQDSSNTEPAALAAVKALNFSAYDRNNTSVPSLQLLPGCKILIYGVTR